MSITIRQGEAEPITFTYKDSDGVAIDVSSDTFSFWVSNSIDGTSPIITAVDGDFDKTDAATGIIYLPISTTDSANDTGDYVSQITRTVDSSNITKHQELFTIVEAYQIVTLVTAKALLQITDSTYDSLIQILIPQVEAKYENIRGISFDVDSNDVIEYPAGSELTASQMIGYLIQTGGLANMSDKKSESIGSYSYTRGGSDEMIEGFPKGIVSQIERYSNPKT